MCQTFYRKPENDLMLHGGGWKSHTEQDLQRTNGTFDLNQGSANAVMTHQAEISENDEEQEDHERHPLFRKNRAGANAGLTLASRFCRNSKSSKEITLSDLRKTKIVFN